MAEDRSGRLTPHDDRTGIFSPNDDRITSKPASTDDRSNRFSPHADRSTSKPASHNDRFNIASHDDRSSRPWSHRDRYDHHDRDEKMVDRGEVRQPRHVDDSSAEHAALERPGKIVDIDWVLRNSYPMYNLYIHTYTFKFMTGMFYKPFF